MRNLTLEAVFVNKDRQFMQNILGKYIMKSFSFAPIVTRGELSIYVFACGLVDTNAYLIVHNGLTEAVLIDAPQDLFGDLKELLEEKAIALKALFLTHGHWDHMADAQAIAQKYNVEVYAHSADKVLYETPRVMSSLMPANLVLEPVQVHHWVEQGQILKFLNQEFEVRHVPGHCPGNILFYTKALGAFVGDAIFQSSIGRTDLPGGNFATLRQSIRAEIYTLPDETVLFPGHGEPTTVGEEALHNPYVQRS